MSEKLTAGICWKSFQYNNINHTQNLVDEGFKFLRIYVNLADFPQATPNQAYINNIMNGHDGMWCWDNFSQRWWSANPNDKVKDSFTFCKANNWLPIVCFGHNEEQASWITRSPGADKWTWLKLMATEFAEYLKANFGFTRVDMESWNEPNECMGASTYANVTINLSQGWKSIYPNSWVHGFASNLREQNYLNDLLAIPTFVKSVNAISPHILTNDEWNVNLIQGTYDKCTAKGLKVTYLEVSPLGDMDRLHMLIDRSSMYALVLWIRNSLIGQGEGIEITDALIYDFDNPSSFVSVNTAKMEWIKTFNKEHTTGVDVTVAYNATTRLTANFVYGEFFCQGIKPPDAYYPNILALAQELQKLRDIFKCPIRILSGYRTVAHNQAVGGAADSQHLTGKAADISVDKFPADKVGYYAARYTNLNGIGFGKATTTHVDTRQTFTPYKY